MSKFDYEGKGVGVVLILLIIAIFVFFFVAITNPANQDATYIKKFNLYKELFREPFESAVFKFQDGSIYVFHTSTENAVLTDPALIVDYFIREEGKKIEDVEYIIHNHFSPSSFSSTDIKTYYYLRGRGFRGKFMIYYPAMGKIRIYGEKNGN